MLKSDLSIDGFHKDNISLSGPEIARITNKDLTPFSNKREEEEFQAKLVKLGLTSHMNML